jgi:transcriptional regulator with XRE-family HTH domain
MADIDRFVWRDGDFIVVPHGEDPPAPKHLYGADRRRAGAELADALGALRRNQHVSQTELAERLGVDQAQVSRLERRGDPQVSTVVDYLGALGSVTAVDLQIKLEDGTVFQVQLKAMTTARPDRRARKAIDRPRVK